LIADAVGVVERPAEKRFCVARLSKPFIDVPWGRDEIKYLIRRHVDNYMVFDKYDVGVSPIPETKAGGRFALTRRSPPLSRQNPTKAKNKRCFINLPLGMLLSFFSCLAI